MVALALFSLSMSTVVRAQSCTTQAEMKPAARAGLDGAALSMAQQIAAGNASFIQSNIAPQVASEAQGILSSTAGAASKVKGAAFIVRNMYVLDATDQAAGGPSTQFFCGSMNEPPQVVFTLGGLQRAMYAVAMVEATGIASPQQMTLIFAQSTPARSSSASSPQTGTPASPWKLAGFAYKPSTMAGHDGIWYWTQARSYAQKKQDWDAYFYLETAQSLLVPVDFLSSTNLDKLLHEENAVKPPGLPGQQPMVIANGTQKFSVTDLHTDGSLGGLDLVARYIAQSVQDPVATRTQNITLMHLMLLAHPELKQAFHGLWVYAVAPGQDPFGIELPMDQIP
ncbi:MAG: hypothetical protein ACYDC6_09970 [Acidobacteriaceae bacterium]